MTVIPVVVRRLETFVQRLRQRLEELDNRERIEIIKTKAPLKSLSIRRKVLEMLEYIYIYIYNNAYKHIYIYTFTHIHAHAHTHISIYIFTHTDTHTHIYIYILSHTLIFICI